MGSAEIEGKKQGIGRGEDKCNDATASLHLPTTKLWLASYLGGGRVRLPGRGGSGCGVGGTTWS